ncbi:MAG: potassium channel family protein [Candidatus Micrarchaeia archaeon]
MAGIATLQEHYLEELRREKARVKRKMVYAITLLGAVYTMAIAAYHYTEKWDWLNAIYFTTETVTTVGYGDMVPHTY